jgi:hypothetical protein
VGVKAQTAEKHKDLVEVSEATASGGSGKPPIKETKPTAPPAEKTPTAKGFGDEDDEPDESPEERDGAGSWSETLRLLESEPSLYAVVCDRSKVSAEIQGDILFVRVGDIFTSNALNDDSNNALITAAAGKALGREVAVRVEVAENGVHEDQVSFEELGAFDVVKIED